ncbi:MAG: transcriptional repressor [Candidatus Glassbacteria bacterium]|nr:transcriptional repressor [Candidatus Glassbacteria bacterium]
MKLSEEEKQRRLRSFIRAARQAGIKLTHQRLEIFREIAGDGRHPDVESIYKRVKKRIPPLSIDTVYRTFSVLEREKVLAKVSVFCNRARFDSNMEPHHHFVCRRCGAVRDFFSHELDRFHVPEEVKPWGDVDTVYVELRGTCAECAGKASAEKTEDRRK